MREARLVEFVVAEMEIGPARRLQSTTCARALRHARLSLSGDSAP